MTKNAEAGRDTDPFEVWRQLYDINERAWSGALEQAMGSPEFSESSGRLLETMLAAQKSIRDNMRSYLETVNVPTREDIARLGELVIGLEEKIDQVADRLDAIEEAVRAVPAGHAGPAQAAGRTAPTKRAKPATRAGQAKGVKPATRTAPTKRAKPVTRAGQNKGVKRAKGAGQNKGVKRAKGAGQNKGVKRAKGAG